MPRLGHHSGRGPGVTLFRYDSQNSHFVLLAPPQEAQSGLANTNGLSTTKKTVVPTPSAGVFKRRRLAASRLLLFAFPFVNFIAAFIFFFLFSAGGGHATVASPFCVWLHALGVHKLRGVCMTLGLPRPFWASRRFFNARGLRLATSRSLFLYCRRRRCATTLSCFAWELFTHWIM